MRRIASPWSPRDQKLFCLGLLALSSSACAGAGAARAPASAVSLRTDTANEVEGPHDPPPAFNDLVALARERLAQPDAPATLPAELASSLAALTYDEHRQIRFRPERSLWRGEPGLFEVQLFHLGHRQLTPVRVNIVDGGTTSPLPYDPSLFVSESGELPNGDVASGDVGYAGLRLHAPLNDSAYRDEVLVFQGASYFRSLGRGQVYGLSARGLAIDTGEARGEEFPRFSQLFLVRPAEHDAHVWLLALMESPRATGAYAFRVEPGAPTEIEVTARVFFREVPGVVGVAPLTSMFLFGEDRPARFGDFRPEVHDSDTLVIHSSSGEQIARSLHNPPRTTVTSHRVPGVRGFGLAQRDRAFASYEDLETGYERRPTAWVEPLDDWGPGAVRLLEISTELETDDNIAAMWVPDTIPADGLSLRYRVSFGDDVPVRGDGARVVSTRIATHGQFTDAGVVRFVVDLAGPSLATRPPSELTWTLDARGAEVIETIVVPNANVGDPAGVRTISSVRVPAGVRDVELRGFLGARGEALSETWSYLWQTPE